MLSEKNMDEIPRYLYLRDVVKCDPESFELKQLKQCVLKNQMITKITDLQWTDGSWGSFHSLSANTSTLSTEMALRRLFYLGLDKQDIPIIHAIKYMESFLNNEIYLRDRIEKKHDWSLLTNLFVSTWMLKFDVNNEIALKHAEKWALIINESFSTGKYDQDTYEKAYIHYLKPEKGKYIWKAENFYVVSIVRNLLDVKSEIAFLEHIINHETGIYYVYDKPIVQMANKIGDRGYIRYLMALDLILDYKRSSELLERNIKQLKSNMSNAGEWDLGRQSKDNIILPFSNSWRTKESRIIDSTILLMKIIAKAGNSACVISDLL